MSAAADSQDSAPLAEAVESFLRDPGAPFTTPGHKRAEWLRDAFLERDLPLATGADDNQLSNNVLGRAEALAAELWGAEYCRFSVNGSTHGNQAMCLAVGAPGDRVAVSRALHKSMFAGLVLAGLEPVWMFPEVDSESGLTVGLPIAEVERALASGVQGVFVVEPSYLGVMSHLRKIADAAHEAGVPVLVDQAWGAHLGLHPELPPNAMQLGADAMVVSAHKTLASFTQGAMLFARGGLLDRTRLSSAFELLNTTSPSAAIYGSLDQNRRIMARSGSELLSRAVVLARGFRSALSDIEGLTVLDERFVSHAPMASAFDPLKLVICLAKTGADGFAVERDLAEAGVRLEMADRECLVPLLTIGDDEESVARLETAVRASIARHRGRARSTAASTIWGLRPETAMSPRDAFFAARERISAAAAVGRICAETAAPYPPGIPALAPGDLITADTIDALRAEAANGSRIAYCSDSTLETLLVVAR